MAETFIFQPTYSAKKNIQPRMKSIKFGNGYEQEYPDGINSIQEDWSITFDRDDSEIEEIDAFFRRNYATFFLWNFCKIWGGEKKYKCREWTIAPLSGNMSRVTAVFKEWEGIS